MKTIGQHMREAREEAGMSRPRLSELSGISKQAIGMYERDEAYPGVLALVALADILKISIDDYIGHRIRG